MMNKVADITPLAVPATRAAALLSMSANTFLARVQEGALPCPRVLGGKRLWLVSELHIALTELPKEGNVDDVRLLDEQLGL